MALVIYKRQRAVLDFISQFMQKNGFAPTLPEICDGIGLRSPATVHEHIDTLCQKGLLRKVGLGIKRGIEVVDQKAAGWVGGIEVPHLGYISAGQPLEVIEDSTESILVPPDMIGARHTFVLQVKGDSMIDASIQDGDYVIIEEQETAENGEIVVALLNESFATLKRYYKEADHIRLEPANSTMNPIISKNVHIQGRVVGVIRKYS